MVDILLVGEVFVDVTIGSRREEHKMRLGGIVHAARGLWAHGTAYSAAICAPSYLEGEIREYLSFFGCEQVDFFGYVTGAPNVTILFDSAEVDDQGYETLLRDAKKIEYTNQANKLIENRSNILIFPGTFDLDLVVASLDPSARLHVDVAYDIESFDTLLNLGRSFETIFISTSSKLFTDAATSCFDCLLSSMAQIEYRNLIFKENRGGSRLFNKETKQVTRLPAQLGITINSVGVGDVYDCAYVSNLSLGADEAAWRASYASTGYAYTTDPELFREYIRRAAILSFEELRDLAGTSLTWEERQQYQIYLAAPDFQRVDRADIFGALSALEYHNFKIRRPVQENGELAVDAVTHQLRATYIADVDLLQQCDLLFAVPNERDPGTLVEIGMAIASKIPVIVFDSRNECANTMVISGAVCYSDNLDACLNAVFATLSGVVAGERS